MSGVRICDNCRTAWSEYYQFAQCPHDYKDVVDDGHGQEIKALFHKLWGRDVGTLDYIKKDWLELQRLLQTRGIEV
jgi:hypothetical protein